MKKFLAILAILLFTNCSVMAESMMVSYNRAGGVTGISRGAGMTMAPHHYRASNQNGTYYSGSRRPNYRPANGCGNGHYKKACSHGTSRDNHYKRPYDRTGQRQTAMTRNMRMQQALEARQKLATTNTSSPAMSKSNKSTTTKTSVPKTYRRNGITYYN